MSRLILALPIALFVVVAVIASAFGPVVAFVLTLVALPGLIAIDRRVMRR